MAGLAPHRHHEVPARRRLGVDHQVAHDLDADVARGLIAEGRDAVRQVEVVVDRLRHVNHVNAAGGGLLDLHRAVGGVVTADGDQLVDVQTQQRRNHALEQLLVLRRVVARGAEGGAAAEMDAAHQLDRQLFGMGDVTAHQPLEAFCDADDVDAVEVRADGRRADHAVDARRGAATNQNPELLRGRGHPGKIVRRSAAR